MLIIAIIAIAVIVFLFMRRKPAVTKSMGTTPPKEEPESNYASIPGTRPFNDTFMKPVSVRNEKLAMMDAVSV